MIKGVDMFYTPTSMKDLEDRLEKLKGTDRHYIRPMTDEERHRSIERGKKR
jgi:hypothetical protein